MKDLGAVPGRTDPTAPTFNRAAVDSLDIPSVLVAPELPLAPIERLGIQKRSHSTIKKRAEWEASHGDISLPPLKPGRNTDAEKYKLQIINQFKGGKALPSDVAFPALQGAIPLSLLSGKASNSSARPPTRIFPLTSVGGEESGSGDSLLLRELRATYVAVAQGMEESEAFMKEVRGLGGASEKEEAAHASSVLEAGRELLKIQAGINKELARLRGPPATIEFGEDVSLSPPAVSPGKSINQHSRLHLSPIPKPISDGDTVGGGFRVFPGSKSPPPPPPQDIKFRNDLSLSGAPALSPPKFKANHSPPSF